ncbi:four helix bundle protein [candidate division WWE3 bacterium CG_4_10_14_0_2_um_filter_42_7]|uniref:Four helix bundle protein n=2 Tax=Katanobacteria TaxID=422282 RepID=A0A2H0X8P2_UNCKA|nr:MAG: four helix bundle protein [candidate division WWE3 bacterium CG08_land_8_20_14_0_20_41_15]PIZ44105.1 MAG: four helix bundle protein [candidate division WWE3 bacterium CG_4_10_14_0_2_um_filter_42_7]
MLDQKSKIKDQRQNKNPKTETRYRAFYLSINIIKFLDNLSYKQSTKIISDQLIRSVTSVGANIVEAKSSSSKREFLNYFQISLKSSNEAKYWLAMLQELLPDRKDEIDIFLQELNEISKIVGTSILTMKGKRSL